MIRNGKTELILGTKDYAKVSPILFDEKGIMIEEISISNPDGCFGPLYVTGDKEILDTIEALVKETV